MMDRLKTHFFGRRGPVLLAMGLAALLLPTVGLYSGGSYTVVVLAVSLALLVSWRLQRHRTPLRPDLRLIGLVGAYLVIGWLSVVWSIVPVATAKAAFDMTLLGVVLLPLVLIPDRDIDLHIILDILVMMVIGAVVLATVDIFIYDWYGAGAAPGHYTVHRVVKYNRGISYLEMMLWPLLAYYWLYRSRAVAVGLAGAVTLITVACASLTAKFALLAGFAVLALGLVATAGTFVAIGAVVVVLGVAMPVILKGASALLLGEAQPLIKLSGIHRLEFWDYMADRVWDRPLFGWGLQSVPALPIQPAELARYHVVTADGIGHAHNLWLQVWVETGLVGAVLFLAFALYVLRQTLTLPASMQPFALAGYTTVLALTISTYNLSADSWWAAIAWTVFLFILISDRCRADGAATR